MSATVVGEAPLYRPDPLLLNLDDAARMLGISKRTLWTLIGAGDLATVRLSRKAVRIRRSDIDDLIRRRTHQARPDSTS